jgi:polyisoprenoid-binding protein YceI
VSRFVIDPDDSRLRALARSSIHPFGYTATISGMVEVEVRDGEFDVSASVNGVLEVRLDSLRGDDPHTDGEMHRRLDTQRFPTARASVRDVHPLGDDGYRLAGEVTLRGTTCPLEGDAVVRLEDGRLRASGSTTLDLRAFGVKVPSMLLLRVHPEVEVTINLLADLEPDELDLDAIEVGDLDGEVTG